MDIKDIICTAVYIAGIFGMFFLLRHIGFFSDNDGREPSVIILTISVCLAWPFSAAFFLIIAVLMLLYDRSTRRKIRSKTKSVGRERQ